MGTVWSIATCRKAGDVVDWVAKLLVLMVGIPLGFGGLWLMFLAVVPQVWYSGGSVSRRRVIGCAGVFLLTASLWLYHQVF